MGAGASIGHSKAIFPSIRTFFRKAHDLGLNSGLIRDDAGFRAIDLYAQRARGWSISLEEVDIEALFTHLEIDIESNSSPKLLSVRQALISLIQEVLIHLEDQLVSKRGEYDLLIQCLKPSDTIVTFNWDLMLDNKLGRNSILSDLYQGRSGVGTSPLQYRTFINELSGFGRGTWGGLHVKPPYTQRSAVSGYYLKMHGSVDWGFCRNNGCRGWHVVFPLIDPLQKHFCSECHEPIETLIIPPVLNKTYRQYPMIRQVWNLAANEIRAATNLVIWGYSLPPTDFYSTWLLSQTRGGEIATVTIIDPQTENNSFVERFAGVLAFRDTLPRPKFFLYNSFGEYWKEKEGTAPESGK